MGAAALVHLRPVLGGCAILPFKVNNPDYMKFTAVNTNTAICLNTGYGPWVLVYHWGKNHLINIKVYTVEGKYVI